jgi:hypothetical protein
MSTIKSSAEDLTLNADGANNDIKFQSNGVEKASIDQDGNLVLSGTLTSVGVDDNCTATKLTVSDSGININGDITFSSASQGICLGVTSNTDSNTLDDYEEGEVTNGLTIDGTTQTSYSSGRSNLQYTKIGRIVHMQGLIDTQGATLAATGVIRIKLPFAVSGGSGTVFAGGTPAIRPTVNGVTIPAFLYFDEGNTAAHMSKISDATQVTVSSTGHRVYVFMAFSYQSV